MLWVECRGDDILDAKAVGLYETVSDRCGSHRLLVSIRESYVFFGEGAGPFLILLIFGGNPDVERTSGSGVGNQENAVNRCRQNFGLSVLAAGRS